jgi:hypothetical protein
MKERIQQSVKILAPIGTLGGFISDVLTPLGPVTKWLFFCSLFISILFLIFYVLNKKKLAQKYLPSSIILALVFGVFFLLNNNTEKGILGDNTESIANLQKSLFNIQETVDRVEDKVDIIDQKLDLGFDKIEDLIKSNNPIENPITAKDFIVNAYLYQSSGLLKKSQISFEEYFRLSEDYKIDVLLDYCDVFESNNGFMALKSQLEILPTNDVTKIVKMIRTSIDKRELYLKLINTNIQIDDKLIKWSVLTLGDADLANSLGSFYDFDSPFYFEWLYNSFMFHLNLGYNCEEVNHYFFNNSKAKDLINTNSFTKKPLYFFYVDYLSLNQKNNLYYPNDGSSGQWDEAKSSWYSEEYKKMAIEMDSLYKSKREEGWFR